MVPIASSLTDAVSCELRVTKGDAVVVVVDDAESEDKGEIVDSIPVTPIVVMEESAAPLLFCEDTGLLLPLPSPLPVGLLPFDLSWVRSNDL